MGRLDHILGRVRGVRDETVATDMAEFAEVFLEGAAADDYPLDYTPAAAGRLDALADMFRAGHPSEEGTRTMAMSMGAFLGELVVRTCGGRWVHDADRRMAAVALPGGRRVYPHEVAHARLTGHGASLDAFYADAAR